MQPSTPVQVVAEQPSLAQHQASPCQQQLSEEVSQPPLLNRPDENSNHQQQTDYLPVDMVTPQKAAQQVPSVSADNHLDVTHAVVKLEVACTLGDSPEDLGLTPQHSSSDTSDEVVDADSPTYVSVADVSFYAFPTLLQLSEATEAALRADGFG